MTVDYISPGYHKKIFSGEQPSLEKNNQELLKKFGLTDVVDESKGSPELEFGTSLSLMIKLSKSKAEAYKAKISSLINTKVGEVIVPCDSSLVINTVDSNDNWMRYDDEWVKCDPPYEETLVIDTETVPSEDGRRWYPFLCICQGKNTYLWVGDGNCLIRTSGNNLFIAHNANYDRAMLSDSYDKVETNEWLDTLSLSVAVRGLGDRIRNIYAAHVRDNKAYGTALPLWCKQYPGALTLDKIYTYYTKKELPKDTRESIINLGRKCLSNPSSFISYCISDVLATKVILKHLWYEYLDQCPSPFSVTGLFIMAGERIPLSDDWPAFIKRANETYDGTMKRINDLLDSHCDKALTEDKDFHTSQLDWKLVKGTPKWYKEAKKKRITLASSITPLLLRITYDGYPVVWSDTNGLKTYKDKDAVPKEGKKANRGFCLYVDGELLKVPNPNGTNATVKTFFTKDMVSLMERGVVSSTLAELKPLLELIRSTAIWTSIKKRINAVFFEKDSEGQNWVIPDDLTLGTITRRKKGPFWPVLTNQKKAFIGSEAKCYVRPPKGHVIVSTDVDGEELNLAALFGDITYGDIAGYSPMATCVLCGQKGKGNDVHSLVAKRLEISRDDAKQIVYGALYGLGRSGAQKYLKLFNPSWSDKEAREKAEDFLAYLKYGDKEKGLASESFSFISDVADSGYAKTPVLNSGIAKTMRGTTDFKTTRDNWVVQSSGRDFLDVCITFIKILAERHKVGMKLFMTVHDSMAYIVREGEEKKAAYIISIAHMFTWSLVIKRLNLGTLPSARKYPEGIEVDYMLRKSPLDPCLTPSKDTPSPPGTILTSRDLINIPHELGII